jgi:hypothetical protein
MNHFHQFIVLMSLSFVVLSCEETNTAPELLPLDELLAPVNQPTELIIFARDAESDRLSFSFTFDPLPNVFTEGALGQPTLTPLSQTQALFQWAPSIADVGVYNLTISVADDQGLSDSETVRLEVFSQELNDQSIRFANPIGAGQSLDVQVMPCLELPVTIVADGIPAEDILIDLTDPLIEGAEFAPPGPFTGKERLLRWCPSPAQLNDSSRYTLTLRARQRLDRQQRGEEQMASDIIWSDGVKKRYLIRLEGMDTPGASECIGRPPSLEHVPPRQISGLDDYRIELLVRDDLGIKSPPLLATWTSDTPPNPSLDDPQWSLSELSPDTINPDLWVGSIPNLDLAVGEESVLSYGFIVTDNDDPSGARCDHTVESIIYELRVVGSADGGGRQFCEPCTLDAQCGGDLDLCLFYGEGTFCGRFCSDDLPCAAGQECIELASPEGVLLDQCVPNSLSCVGQCMPDQFDMSPTTSADTAPTLTEGNYPSLSLCDDEVDLYQVMVPEASGIEVALTFNASMIDLDLFLALESQVTAQGQLQFQYESSSSNQSPERIRVGCVRPGGGTERAWIAVTPYDATDRGGYELNVSFPSNGCNVSCQDDALEATEAASIVDGVYTQLQLCPNDVDLFVFEVDAGWVISAFVDFDQTMGDLNLTLYDDNQSPILRDDGVRSGAIVEWRTDRAGMYALEVSGATPMVQNQYTLDLYLFPTEPCASTISCQPDQFCYPQLGCLDDSCGPTLSCGENHTCILPVRPTSSEAEGHCSSRCMNDSECRAHERCKLLASGQRTCIESGERIWGETCTQHRECSSQLVCADSDTRAVCLNLGCDRCSAGEICAEMVYGDSCLPTCDTGCPSGWVCREQDGVDTCFP